MNENISFGVISYWIVGSGVMQGGAKDLCGRQPNQQDAGGATVGGVGPVTIVVLLVTTVTDKEEEE